MKSIYSAPLRVYLILGFLAAIGVWAGQSMSVSLYPNVRQPAVSAGFDLQGMTPEDFRKQYGFSIEKGLADLRGGGLEVEEVAADYSGSSAQYDVQFGWNADPFLALKEVRNFLEAASASLPREIRDTRWAWSRAGRDQGFFLATARSDSKIPTEIFERVDPLLRTRTASLQDGSVDFWNPDKEQVLVDIKAERMAAHGLYPKDVIRAIEEALSGASGGSFQVGPNSYRLLLPRQASSVEDLENLLIKTSTKGLVRLGGVATLSVQSQDSKVYRTNGYKSLLLIGRLDEGGNIKRLSEDISRILAELESELPDDIHFDVLIDPSVAISDSIKHVFIEVGIGASLAVLILFVFIGSLRNVVTAAIEIPMSLVLAFIVMKLTGMNLNLISLGGLALSAGMNVDASVVVMENIFRKFEGVKPGSLSASERLARVVEATKEVFAPVVAATISSLVVFVPIVFTADLTNAILGDLARAVVFSHMFSAFVAFLLVPTVRLHLMKNAPEASMSPRSPVEGVLERMERVYVAVLRAFVSRKLAIGAALLCLCGALGALGTVLLPKLPKEIVGKPDTDIVGMWVGSKSWTKVQQAEAELSTAENTINAEFPGLCHFTYMQVLRPSGGFILCRLGSKSETEGFKKQLEDRFRSTPEIEYDVWEWSVASLPLPRISDVLLEVTGPNWDDRSRGAAMLLSDLKGRFEQLSFVANPSLDAEEVLDFQPREDVWKGLAGSGFSQSPEGLLQALRQYGSKESVATLTREGESSDILLTSSDLNFRDPSQIRALPIAVGEKIVPLSALFSIEESKVLGNRRYVDTEPKMEITARVVSGDNKRELAAQVNGYVEANEGAFELPSGVKVSVGEADKVVREAIDQLTLAATWSFLLIFVTMLLQFGTIIEALLVLVAAPLAFLGVVTSLSVFGSTLSVNSVLGIIMLNGISVANSILLVDYARRQFALGQNALESVLMAARRRLRPILITSLTTILGMMPIALGYGEGGKVLQPLGIAVSGGMGFSTLLTIFVVPALHGVYLARLEKKRAHALQETSA